MQRQTIMIVDDDAPLLDAIRVRCEALGVTVLTFSNPLEAMHRADREPPDLIILDVNMPAGNGLAACELVSSSSRLESIPVVIMTGDCDDDTRRRTQHAGARYVRKGTHLWSRLEPIICRELGLEVPAQPIDSCT